MLVQFTKTLLLKITIKRISLCSYRLKNTFKVTVCGAKGSVGRPLSLMLKQSPVIQELSLYSRSSTAGVAMDIGHVDTKCNVTAYCGDELPKALKNARIVMITAGIAMKPGLSREDMFEENAKIVKSLTEACVQSCPEALIGIVTNPVNSMVPVASAVFAKAGMDNNNRIFGVTTLDSVRANIFASHFLQLKPEEVSVPVIGGHSNKTIIPLFSQMCPPMQIDETMIEKLTNTVQNAGYEVAKAKDGMHSATLSTAYAVARFTASLAKGLLGEEIIDCAFVRSDAVKECQFFAIPFILGPQGIKKAFGIPKLSAYETRLLQSAIPFIKQDIKKGILFMKNE